MKVEAVIICKDYSDFLEHTLPENLQHLDDVVVMTSPEDFKTQKLCARLSVQCVTTTVFTEGGDTFRKGAAINLGINHLKKEDWLLHIDADIVLPHRFRHMLERAQLNVRNIYGADRMNVYGYEAWTRMKHLLVPHFQDRWFVDPGFCHVKEPVHGVKFGARVIHNEYGWVPIGFFQLWHRSANKSYNHKLGSAAGSDVLFPTHWPRENRILLPEIVVYHLDSELEHGIGTNWKGRKSRHFGPEDGGAKPHKKCDEKNCHEHHHSHAEHHHHHQHHHHHKPPCPYDGKS